MQNNLIEENKLLNNKDGENKEINGTAILKFLNQFHFNSIQWEENKI